MIGQEEEVVWQIENNHGGGYVLVYSYALQYELRPFSSALYSSFLFFPPCFFVFVFLRG